MWIFKTELIAKFTMYHDCKMTFEKCLPVPLSRETPKNSQNSAHCSIYYVSWLLSWLSRNAYLRHFFERHQRILKTVLTAQFSVTIKLTLEYCDYKADSWEMSTCTTFESDTDVAGDFQNSAHQF